jgi:hypothetical protein
MNRKTALGAPETSAQQVQQQLVIDRLDEAARVLYHLAGLAVASGALARAERFVENAVHLTACKAQVAAGDAELTRALASAIDVLPRILPRAGRDR